MKQNMLVAVVGVGLIGLLILIFNACSHEPTARLEVRLTDSPGNFEAVYIDIQDVLVNNSEDSLGWKSLGVAGGIYDLLKLTNGIDTLLGSITLPSGKLHQIRLVLGTENTVVVDGQTYPLKTPSAQQSGLKIRLNKTLVEGVTYTIVLDFDAARSIVNHGKNAYSLKPVIRALDEGTSGAIKGQVTPAQSHPVVYAILEMDTVGTACVNGVGKFLIQGIAPGTYTVSIVPKEGFTTVDKTDVVVTTGSVTDLGTITVP